ncbi:hypothetical protein FOA52_011554 [Chlamydomonas sp. UWO 241]|nr:hypothetical protein FOA52_011554 [Chlamydomonas sp. UWO 241]
MRMHRAGATSRVSSRAPVFGVQHSVSSVRTSPSCPAALPKEGVNAASPAPRVSAARSVQRASRVRVSAAAANPDYRSKAPKDVRVLVVGPTGYIGKFVTNELIKRGYDVVAFSRPKAGIKGKMSKEDTTKEFPGATVCFGDVADPKSIRDVAFEKQVDVVVSCLASRTGGKKDSWAIDYQATKNVLDVAREKGAAHFVLLSAICVQKPTLEFQKAKLKFEGDLAAAGDITYSIVRPTAFFKSLAGQIELVKQGKPYVMFGDGNLASCKPISEADLANFIADCAVLPDKINKLLPIGGPGRAYSAKDQADMLFRITGNKPNYFPVPIALMGGIIGLIDFFARFFPEQLEDAAEFGRIGRYYAEESMLVWDPVKEVYVEALTPSYGKDTLEAFFTKAVKEGLKGQELGDQAVF